MKVGITLKDYYEQFLDKIANLNGLSRTAVCGLIVENFLSFNLRQKRLPLFHRQVNIVFANEKDFESDRNSASSVDSSGDLGSSSEPVMSMSELVAKLNQDDHYVQHFDNDVHDDLPF